MSNNYFMTYFVDGSSCCCDDEYQLREHYDQENTDPISHVHTIWNGHPVRPPVGIRAKDCSHRWTLDYFADHDEKGRLPSKLVPQ